MSIDQTSPQTSRSVALPDGHVFDAALAEILRVHHALHNIRKL